MKSFHLCLWSLVFLLFWEGVLSKAGKLDDDDDSDYEDTPSRTGGAAAFSKKAPTVQSLFESPLGQSDSLASKVVAVRSAPADSLQSLGTDTSSSSASASSATADASKASDTGKAAAAASLSSDASKQTKASSSSATDPATSGSDSKSKTGSASSAADASSDSGSGNSISSVLSSLIAESAASNTGIDVKDTIALKRSTYDNSIPIDVVADADHLKKTEEKRSPDGTLLVPGGMAPAAPDAEVTAKRDSRGTIDLTTKSKRIVFGTAMTANKIRRRFPLVFCELERDNGIVCPGVRRGNFMDQFYYDPEINRCQHFVYNGCGGNANRFSSLWECNMSCAKKSVATVKIL